jgi:hypothetical protein
MVKREILNRQEEMRQTLDDWEFKLTTQIAQGASFHEESQGYGDAVK